ncbi:class I SAM-dependent methyltransferase [Streptomyces sp. NPDC088116]|uniref:class I SAM-dependent methyltransferase n=1 Tax=Streptomyces sp. NPDC088116 TaxID=3365825 RepID=UPI0037F467A8
MNTTDETRYTPEWLELREGADAAARARDFLDPLRDHLAAPAARHRRDSRRPGPVPVPGPEGRTEAEPSGQKAGPATELMDTPGELVIRDLGCGTGSMGRWLAPRLNGPQHWILHDRDPDLLDRAVARMPRAAADGSPVTVTTEQGDIAALTAADLAGTSLVTASALLDLLTRDEVESLAAACAGAGCPALLTLSVAGLVELTPADPLDAEIGRAFNAHQRRVDHGRGLLGPDAITVARETFNRQDGGTVRTYASAWRLGADESELTAQWLRGWVGAAREQRPELAPLADAYLTHRLATCAAGELRAVVHHSDLLALPRLTGETR